MIFKFCENSQKDKEIVKKRYSNSLSLSIGRKEMAEWKIKPKTRESKKKEKKEKKGVFKFSENAGKDMEPDRKLYFHSLSLSSLPPSSLPSLSFTFLNFHLSTLIS